MIHPFNALVLLRTHKTFARFKIKSKFILFSTLEANSFKVLNILCHLINCFFPSSLCMAILSCILSLVQFECVFGIWGFVFGFGVYLWYLLVTTLIREAPFNLSPPLFGHCPNSNYTPPPHSNGHSGALFSCAILPFFTLFTIFYHFFL